jgi:hypothetical protein
MWLQRTACARDCSGFQEHVVAACMSSRLQHLPGACGYSSLHELKDAAPGACGYIGLHALETAAATRSKWLYISSRLHRLPGACGYSNSGACGYSSSWSLWLQRSPEACGNSRFQEPVFTAASRSLHLQRFEPAATVLFVACGYSTSKIMRLKCCLELAAVALPASCNHSEFQAPVATAAGLPRSPSLYRFQSSWL